MSQSRSHPLIPVRILNEYAYCPRLAHLEWVQGEFADNADTVEGRFVHRRVDNARGRLPPADDLPETGKRTRKGSVTLADEELGIVGKLDLVEIEGGEVRPVDTKRGSPPDIPQRAWPPERVQIGAQVLLLRSHGYRCNGGDLAFAGTRERVEVPLDDELEALVRETIRAVRELSLDQPMPPPLVDSPKCDRCSLVSICLPDEVNAFDSKGEPRAPRNLRSPRDLGQSLYVMEPGAMVRKVGDQLEVHKKKEKLESVRLRELQDVQIYGNVQVTSTAQRELARRNIPLAQFSRGGWLEAITIGNAHKNILVRRAQFRLVDDAERCLSHARVLVQGKIKNCRTLLRRNAKDSVDETLLELARHATGALRADSLSSLLGIEGAAARAYFQSFSAMLRADLRECFDLDGRNRRPPRDPVNALLSFLYSMLIRDTTSAVLLSGLDPFIGIYHQPKYGKPALALDLCEEFRPLIADSTAISLLNNEEVQECHFLRHGHGCNLTKDGRRIVLQAYERRLRQTVRHPRFRYSIQYRQVLAVQARLLGRLMLEEIDSYPSFLTR